MNNGNINDDTCNLCNNNDLHNLQTSNGLPPQFARNKGFERTVERIEINDASLNELYPDMSNEIITDINEAKRISANPKHKIIFKENSQQSQQPPQPLKKIEIINPPLPKNRNKARHFVSVIVPTWKRRNFLPNLIAQFNYQTYPQENMELIIIDDSPESNQDIIPDQANIRYIYIDEHIKLGYKRNLLNKAAIGDIIVCFDDDDYYSPERVSHAVTKLNASKCQIAASSIIHIYYTHLDQIYEFGPYGNYHGTNGTMAYTKKYLLDHNYIDDKEQAEESHFTNQFSEPMCQLDPRKVMLCISHKNNTINKNQFIPQGKKTQFKINKFFKVNNKKMLNTIKNYSAL